jgi:anti-sigma-K factor RskA
MTHDDFEALAALDAIGAATAEEQRSFEAHAAGCESCRAARDEFGEAATLLAQGLEPAVPPADVRDRVLALTGATGVSEEEIAEEELATGEYETNVLTSSRWKIRPWWLATAATLFLALWGWREMGIHVAKERMRSQEAELESLQEQNDLLAREKAELSTELATLGEKNTKAIELAGQQVSPNAAARVFLEPEQRRAIVFFTHLPANARDRSYQLWVIPATDPAKPRSAGVFDADPNGNATLTVENLPVATEIKALAVTLEPRGGVEQPTSSTFYLAGNT